MNVSTLKRVPSKINSERKTLKPTEKKSKNRGVEKHDTICITTPWWFLWTLNKSHLHLKRRTFLKSYFRHLSQLAIWWSSIPLRHTQQIKSTLMTNHTLLWWENNIAIQIFMNSMHQSMLIHRNVYNTLTFKFKWWSKIVLIPSMAILPNRRTHYTDDILPIL